MLSNEYAIMCLCLEGIANGEWDEIITLNLKSNPILSDWTMAKTEERKMCSVCDEAVKIEL